MSIIVLRQKVKHTFSSDEPAALDLQKERLIIDEGYYEEAALQTLRLPD
jgi:hypothetical protein